jgi:CelD/BcsL family acetyltransferase involved in cellulose biosynthesis
LTHWKLQWLVDWRDIWCQSFVAKWRQMIDQSETAHVFFEPSLVKAWTKTHEQIVGLEPRFVLGKHASGIELLMPLVKMRYGWRSGWVRTLGPIGANEFDYHDPIVTGSLTEKDWTDFWNAIDSDLSKKKADFDRFDMPRIRPPYNGDSNRFSQKDIAPFIDLTQFESSEKFLLSRSQKFRQNIRRSQRHLQELAETRLHVFEAGETEAALAIAKTFMEAHKASWPRAYRAPKWYEILIREVMPTGLLQMSTIEHAARSISWNIGFLHKNRFYCYVSAYDRSLSKFSPGQLHLLLLIQNSYRLNATFFDFLRGQEWYKSEWTNTSEPLCGYEWMSPCIGSSCRRNLRNLLYRSKQVFRSKR